MIQAIIFDLDDTLYPEIDFVKSGYRSVAQYMADSWDCSFDDAFSLMIASFDAFGRAVFPELLAHFPHTTLTLDECVHIYRQHSPAIHLFPGYLPLLMELSQNYRLGLITDGLPAVQKKKVKALGLEDVIHEILYSWDHGAERQKPHPHSFSLMLESLHADPPATLFIGDNPEKDGLGAQNAGMHYAQIQHQEWKPFRPDAMAQGRPEFIIESLLQLPQVLQQLN